jgi:hypothetical protein
LVYYLLQREEFNASERFELNTRLLSSDNPQVQISALERLDLRQGAYIKGPSNDDIFVWGNSTAEELRYNFFISIFGQLENLCNSTNNPKVRQLAFRHMTFLVGISTIPNFCMSQLDVTNLKKTLIDICKITSSNTDFTDYYSLMLEGLIDEFGSSPTKLTEQALLIEQGNKLPEAQKINDKLPKLLLDFIYNPNNAIASLDFLERIIQKYPAQLLGKQPFALSSIIKITEPFLSQGDEVSKKIIEKALKLIALWIKNSPDLAIEAAQQILELAKLKSDLTTPSIN